MVPFRRLSLIFSALAFVAFGIALFVGVPALWQPSACASAAFLAIGLSAYPATRGYQFTAWIITAVMAAMLYPSAFLRWGTVDLRNRWLLLLVVQLVMFGMGTQMSLRDFRGVVKTPRGVLVGILCHFSVMPLVGFFLAKVFHFEPEIAAGIILIGSCSSGLASNVMAYIAKSNLALSVTVTAITTLVAPFMTPLLMKWLAGAMVEVKFVNMMMEIIKMVIVPIGAAMLHDYLRDASSRAKRIVGRTALTGAAWLGAVALGGWTWAQGALPSAALTALALIGFFFAAIIAGWIYHRVATRWANVERRMPVASMAGIVYFTTVTTAAGRDNLLKIGALLFIAAALHNAAGYFFGYWLSRAAGLDKNSARSVAFEVGLQNGGMASGLAGAMGKLGTVGLAAAIFSPWMNVSGSVLANYWRRKPVNPN